MFCPQCSRAVQDFGSPAECPHCFTVVNAVATRTSKRKHPKTRRSRRRPAAPCGPTPEKRAK